MNLFGQIVAAVGVVVTLLWIVPVGIFIIVVGLLIMWATRNSAKNDRREAEEELLRLHELRSRGLISPRDFDARKAALEPKLDTMEEVE